jgi:hypothetical protein
MESRARLHRTLERPAARKPRRTGGKFTKELR